MKSRNKPWIYIDMDDTIAECTAKVVEIYNKYNNANVKDCGGWGFPNLSLASESWIKGLFKSSSFFYDLEPIDGAIEMLKELDRLFNISICTIGYASAIPGKLAWLEKYAPFIAHTVIIAEGNNLPNLVSDKSILTVPSGYTPYLVDDNPRNLSTFKGVSICYGDYDYNRDWKGLKFTNYERLTDYLKSLYVGGANENTMERIFPANRSDIIL